MVSSASGEITIDGRALEFVDLSGDPDRAPLILLHEGLGSIGLWRGFPTDLCAASGRRVVAFSRHGHGRSQSPPRPRTPAFFDHEAFTVLPALRAALALPEPVLVGHSDGASIAIVHASREPVRGLVLLAPHVFVEPVTVAAIRQTREAYVRGALRERMARHHDDPDAAFWGWCDVWLHPGFSAWNIEAEAARVSAPTLLIQGADDPYGTLEQLDRLEARVPDVQRWVPPGGHSPHLEHGPAVIDAITRFLRDVG
jgi:pimeloyl-ACP methyl ester carboxylesterase